MAIPRVQFTDRAVNVPLVKQKDQKTVKMLQLQFLHEMANVPVGWMDRCS